MQMDVGMDTGDILLMRETDIGAEETTGVLWNRLSNMGADLLVETIASLDSITPIKQDDAQATYAPMLEKSDGAIDWNQPATDICNRIRGVNPNPGAHTIPRATTQNLVCHSGRWIWNTGSVLVAKKKSSSQLVLEPCF